MRSRTFPATGILGLLVAAMACGDNGVGNLEDINIRMQRIDDGTALQVVAGWSASLSGSELVAISPDTVQSLTVTVDSIQALPVENETDEENDAAWVTINLDAPATLDLMALPTEASSPVVIAAGTVEAGDYAKVRLFVSEASIVFKGPVDLGSGFSFVGGDSYPVTTPSAAQSGIKTDAAFTAAADANVDLLFDPETSLSNVTATGNGTVILAPVIRARP